MRFLVASLISWLSLSAFDMVEIDTPRIEANSFKVILLAMFCFGFEKSP
jgi:hypothetical protein